MPENPADRETNEPPMFSTEATPGAKARRPRRASPLGLMGPGDSEIPKASPLPSARAVGIMVGVMAAVFIAVTLGLRGC